MGSGCNGLETLLLYFCVSFMARFSVRLQSMDFESITMFFKSAPTDSVSESDVELLLGEAYVLKNLFQQAPNHLNSGRTGNDNDISGMMAGPIVGAVVRK